MFSILALENQVFPMYVGVILFTTYQHRDHTSIPHVGGGDPLVRLDVSGAVLVFNVIVGVILRRPRML